MDLDLDLNIAGFVFEDFKSTNPPPSIYGPDYQIRICGFGFEPPDLDLDLDLAIFQKVGFGFWIGFES